MSEPAFPFHEPGYGGGKYHHGLTKIEMACIELRIPRTGNQDLDDLILEAQRRDVAAMAMQGNLSATDVIDSSPEGIAGWSVRYADALLAELAKPQEPTP